MEVLELGKIKIAGGGDHIAFIDGKGLGMDERKNSNGQLIAGDQNIRNQLTEVFTGNAEKSRRVTTPLFSDFRQHAMETRLSGIGGKLVLENSFREVLDFGVGNPIFVVKKTVVMGLGIQSRGQF